MSAFTLEEVPVELARLGGADAWLDFPAQGMTSDVAFFGEVVLKRCVDPRYVDWLRREHAVLVALRDIELPAPRVLGLVERDAEVWLAITRLPGVPLTQALQAADGPGRAQLLFELGALLRRVHATEIPAALREDVPWMDRMLVRAQRNLSWCDGDRELLDELVAHRPAPLPETFIHGDLGLDNVLVDRGRVTALVDWPMGGCGDPRFDVAIAVEHDDELPFDDAQLTAFWAGYDATSPDVATVQWFQRLWDFF